MENRVFHAPGRVNIIGEHLDYNGGYVLPFSISMGTRAFIRKRNDNIIRFSSENFPGTVEAALDNLAYDAAHDWANYPMGILYYMKKPELTGFDVHFSGNIPNGAGLSSSASVSLVMAVALNTVFSLGFDMRQLVKIAQMSENKFCGVNCGIMDQFAIGMGRKNYAVYLHCDTLEYSYVPLVLGDCKFIIMNTNKRRSLNESKYNERRSECEKALQILSKRGITKLTGLTPKEFGQAGFLIGNETLRRRARHVICENNRVAEAVNALKNGDTAALGGLLAKSHFSLRDDYEVSCRELDTIVDEAMKVPACLGARMTGAGFGGCAIALVKRNEAERFIEAVSEGYEKIIGYAPTMYECESGDGAGEI